MKKKNSKIFFVVRDEASVKCFNKIYLKTDLSQSRLIIV